MQFIAEFIFQIKRIMCIMVPFLIKTMNFELLS